MTENKSILFTGMLKKWEKFRLGSSLLKREKPLIIRGLQYKNSI